MRLGLLQRIQFIVCSVLAISVCGSSALALTLTAMIYELKSERKKPIFKLKYEIITTPEGVRRQATHYDLADKLVTVDYVDIVNGHVVSGEYSDPRRGELGKIKVENGRIHYEYTLDGKTKKDDEKITDNFVTDLTMAPYLETRWDELLAGKEVEVRFMVMDRLETVGFTFVRQPKMEKPGEMVLKMKATSFIIRALVDPLYFHFDANNKNLLWLTGRARPLVGEKPHWKPVDAEVVYDWTTAIP